jgi:sarcosine oxidase gamma subunit
MLDVSAKWRPEPDWTLARLAGPNLTIGTVAGLTQRLVSGDVERFLARHDLGKDIGALGLAVGERYVVRVARDRLLVVGISSGELADGWHDEGWAATTVSAALRVIEAKGDGVRDLLARGTALDPDNAGPCAAMPFAGMMATIYRHADTGSLRIHIDRGLASYLWEWLECQPLLGGNGEPVPS